MSDTLQLAHAKGHKTSPSITYRISPVRSCQLGASRRLLLRHGQIFKKFGKREVSWYHSPSHFWRRNGSNTTARTKTCVKSSGSLMSVGDAPTTQINDAPKEKQFAVFGTGCDVGRIKYVSSAAPWLCDLLVGWSCHGGTTLHATQDLRTRIFRT
jgi:hypothetical protein